MSKQSSENFYILALDGGGTRGIYPACILTSIERNLGKPIKDCFDLIIGTSTDATIADAAATGVKMTIDRPLYFRNHAKKSLKP